MAYIKRGKYVLTKDKETLANLLEVLTERFGAVKAKNIVFYSVPMSKKRWSKWLDFNEFDDYLEEE